MLVNKYGKIDWYQFHSLVECGLSIHAVSGRAGGYSASHHASLNLSYAVGDDPSLVLANRRLLCEALGMDTSAVVCAEQIHGSHIVRVGRYDRGAGLYSRASSIRGADGLVTNETGVLLLLTFADCVPIVLYDPVMRAVGLIHGGWRGTVNDIASKGVAALTSEFGSRPADIRAGIGPAIGPCCYEVGPKVAEQFRDRFHDDCVVLSQENGDVHDSQSDGVYGRRSMLDLVRANVISLSRSGVPTEQIETAEVCTGCRVDLFYSYRAEEGSTGRFATAVGLG